MLILGLIAGFVICLAATPLTIYLANRFGLVDNPKLRPHPAHIQNRIVPRAGGLAIFIGLFSSILIFLPIDTQTISLLLALSILLIMGLLDDKLRSFSPYLRIFLQILAASIVVFGGVKIGFITNPNGGIIDLNIILNNFNFFGLQISPIPDILAILWIVAIMNVVNWSKGVDGQMPGIISVAAITIGLIAYRFFLKGDPTQLDLATLSFITAGVSIGFLFSNWHPAKIFPGFSGSTILGFMIAYLSILSSAKIAAALLVLLIPVVDFIYTVIRRILSGRSPVWGDRGHLHHKLLSLGWSHQKISFFYILTGTTLGLLSIFLSGQSKLFVLLSLTTLAFIVLYLLHIIIGRKEND